MVRAVPAAVGQPEGRRRAPAHEHADRRPRRAAGDPRPDARHPPDGDRGRAGRRGSLHRRADPRRAGSSSCPAATTSCGPATPTRSSTRSRSSSPACAEDRTPTACSRPCCSPTSSARRRRRPHSATARWRALLDRHHQVVRRELERLRGREVDTAGDGFLATFDGPARAVRCAVAATEGVRDARAGDPGRPPHRRGRDAPTATCGHRRPHRRPRRGPRRRRARSSCRAP